MKIETIEYPEVENVQHRIAQVADAIIEDYEKDIETHSLPTELNNPDRTVISEILDNLKRLILVGYFEDSGSSVYTVRSKLFLVLNDIMCHLSQQIASVLDLMPGYMNVDGKKRIQVSEGFCLLFIEKLPKIREYIKTDLLATFEGDPAAFDNKEIIYSYPGFNATLIYRIAHELYTLAVPLIPRIMTEYAHTLTGIDIHPGADIGKYFFIDHGTGIVIGETTTIGNNVKIYQGVTLGALSTKGGQKLNGVKRHPTILDNVTIYSGASILGGNTVIGNNSVICGNTFVTSSVPDNTRVANEKPHLIMNDKEKDKSLIS